jgi:predicted secreted protein
MSITSAIVLYAVIWFMTMLVALPIGLRTQGDEGEIVNGTHAGAPANYNPRRKAIYVSIVALVIWGAVATFLFTTDLTWRDFDWTQSSAPASDS